jgi:hypothetical protein
LNIGHEEDEAGKPKRLGFGDQMMTALELQAEAMGDECLEIADAEEEFEAAGEGLVARNSLGHRTLKIKTRQYLMAANARAKWGVQRTAALQAQAPLRLNSAIRRGPKDPLLIEGTAEPVSERPESGGMVEHAIGSLE